MDRRALMAASQMGGDNNIITLRPYPEMSQEEGLTLLDFFTTKYGIPYGTENNPLPLNEIVQTSGFEYLSDSEISHIYIDNLGNIQFRNDAVWDYYCVRLTYEGYCEIFMWD